MSPIKSSLAKSVSKLLGVYKDTDLSLRGDVQTSRHIVPSGTLDNPYRSAAAAYDEGAPSGTYYFEVQGSSMQMEYDSTDKFSNGVSGWVKWNRAFVKTISTSDITIYNNGTGATCAWTDQTERQWQNGNTTSNTGDASMGRITIPFPNCQYAVINSLTAVASGNQDPDDHVSWLTPEARYSLIDNYCYGTSGFDTNPSGYAWAIVDDITNTPTSDGTNTNNSTGIILVKLGNEFGDNATGTNNGTFAGGDFSIASFNAEKSNVSMVAFSGDSGAEVLEYTEYEVWAH